jgi:hypothetical protein
MADLSAGPGGLGGIEPPRAAVATDAADRAAP